MADKKNRKTSEEVKENTDVPNSPETPSMEEKLKAAAGNITKAHANHRERNSELVKRRVKAEKESKARLEEAEKRRLANEKHAQQVAEKKLAEFDYAQNYRKKLLKEREEAMSAAKQKKAEAREAAVREAKEAREQTVASYLEMERKEAQERSDRADALVNSVTKKEVIDEEGNKILVDRFPKKPDEALQTSEADETTPAYEKTEVADEANRVEEVSDTENVVNNDESPVQNADDVGNEEPAVESVEEPVAEADNTAEQNSDSNEIAEEVVDSPEDADEGQKQDDGEEDINDIFKKLFENSDLVFKNEEPDGNSSDGEFIPVLNAEDDANEKKKGLFEKKRGEKAEPKRQKRETKQEPENEPSTLPDELAIQGEIVHSIKTEGALLNTLDSTELHSYLNHSKKALRNLKAARKEGVKALDANRDDREAPAILAGIIKICGKILDIRSNNLEVLVRLKARDYISEARRALHDEIEIYNDYVVTFSSITGEQLTRISTFLPENIVKGKALSVIPDLFYQESYVQTYPDITLDGEEGAAMIIVPAAKTAEDLFGNCRVPSHSFGCAGYLRKAKRAVKKLQRLCNRLSREIYKTKVSGKLYKSEMERLEMRTPASERSSTRYKDKAFRISIKYGKQLTNLNTLKTKSAFSKEKRRLFINRMALEREKLVVAYMALRAIYRAGKPAQRSAAEQFFTDALLSYNKYAEICSKLVGIKLSLIPSEITEQVRRAKDEIDFPVIAYKRQLVETVGDSSRVISMALRNDLDPNIEGYVDNAAKIMGSRSTVNPQTLSADAMMADRASAIASVMIDSLRESADMVVTINEIEQFRAKSQKAIKYFKRALKASEKAISRAFDENGVITALVENLRVIANLIEVRRINISVAMRLNRADLARSDSRALYKNIELYNGRAIDYMSIVGDQFSRISINTPKELLKESDALRVPVITYKDNYIEVFPKDPLADVTYEKPVMRRGGVYTPLLMRHFRLTENRSVETTVINSPFVFDVSVHENEIRSWWHPVGFGEHFFIWTQPIAAWWRRMTVNAEIWFIDESLLFAKEGLKGRYDRNERRIRRYERKLESLQAKHRAEVLKLETVIHELDRHTAEYQKKLKKINVKFGRKIYRLKMRWMNDCLSRTKERLLLEKLVLERERLIGINKVLVKYRSYGRITFTPNVLVKYKRRFIQAINDHNKTAAQLSDLMGVKFSEVSTSVAEEIIRYGNMVKFPQIVCCREIIETIDGRPRTVGDRWHGYGLYTGATGTEGGAKGAPVMSVGAMGYSTDMGVPYFKADFDGMTMLGMTPGGVPLIGFGKSGEAAIPFTGTPMMLAGEDYSPVLDAGRVGQDGPILGGVNTTDPYSGINSAAVDSEFVDEIEYDAKDIMSGCKVETPLDLEAKMIEERFSRALRARSMTTVDGIKTWWSLIGSEINLGIMRWLTLRPKGFLRILLPPDDFYTEIINLKINRFDAEILERIAKVGLLVDIECKRLYSATKAGIRRSQRIWSVWLHADIEKYNDLVHQYNSRRKNRNEWLETLSLNIPDTIIHRLEDRPPVPPVYAFRNKVKLAPDSKPITVDGIYKKLYEFCVKDRGGLRHLRGLTKLFTRHTIRRIERANRKGKRVKALRLISRVINRRTIATETWRWDNENRHYRIRYEKGRAMKRYNKRVLRAIGVASDPIKYQIKSGKVLRQYVQTNFRIDYNMRIRQLIYRALRIGPNFYVRSSTLVFLIVAVSLILAVPAPYIQAIFALAALWILLPIELLLLQLFYEVLLMIFSLLTIITRNIWLVKYGARDVERNRYGAILECFVCEEYKILLACERMRNNANSDSQKREFIRAINDYNKLTEKYSKVLKVPIKKIEITHLLEKLTTSPHAELMELQDFIYVRELVERVDEHKVGKTLPPQELKDVYNDIQSIIDILNTSNARDEKGFDELQKVMQTLVNYIQTGVKPNENQRYDLKANLISAINAVSPYLSKERMEIFSRSVIKVVNQLGGRDSRIIVTVFGGDDMLKYDFNLNESIK